MIGNDIRDLRHRMELHVCMSIALRRDVRVMHLLALDLCCLCCAVAVAKKRALSLLFVSVRPFKNR